MCIRDRDIDDEHRLLLVTSDNDFVPEQSTAIYAFAVPKAALLESDVRISNLVGSGNHELNQ